MTPEIQNAAADAEMRRPDRGRTGLAHVRDVIGSRVLLETKAPAGGPPRPHSLVGPSKIKVDAVDTVDAG
jgi:hypothetical protein